MTAPQPTTSPARPALRRPLILVGLALSALLILMTACGSTVEAEDAGSAQGLRIPTPGPRDEEAVPAADTDSGDTASGDADSSVTEDDAAPTDDTAPIVEATPQPVDPRDVVAARLVVDVLAEYPHREDNFTQGLLLDADGRMFESTGSYGASTTRLIEVDRATGEPVRQTEGTSDVWGEGLALIDDRFVQLTWQAEVAFVWDVETFEKIGEYRYDTAGWGLCFDETQDRLVMSDGSSDLVFRDPDTFAPLGEPLEILLDGVPLTNINELECVNGRIWANVFLTDLIVEIDTTTGAVVTVVDASSLNQPRSFDSNAVLNGIAYDPVTEHFLVTGKFWPTLYEVDFVSP